MATKKKQNVAVETPEPQAQPLISPEVAAAVLPPKKSWLHYPRKALGYALFALAWLLAQAIRFAVDVQKRKELCHQLTERPARAVAYSYTVRAVYLVVMIFCFYQAVSLASADWFMYGGWLFAAWLFAEAIWAFVLYVAAITGRLDDAVEAALGMQLLQLSLVRRSKAKAKVSDPINIGDRT